MQSLSTGMQQPTVVDASGHVSGLVREVLCHHHHHHSKSGTEKKDNATMECLAKETKHQKDAGKGA